MILFNKLRKMLGTLKKVAYDYHEDENLHRKTLDENRNDLQVNGLKKS